MNRITITGRLTKDPELKYTAGGKAVCKFTLAVDRPGKDKGADFLNVVTWEKAADFAAKYTAKGKRVLVNGRIETRSWDKEDGSKGFATEIVADPFGGIEPIDWPENGATHGEQMHGQPSAEDNFYDNSGFSPSPVDPNEPGF